MSELRQDLTTHDWVIIAKERAKRPHELTKGRATDGPHPGYVAGCPFCPGNEHMTPEASVVYDGQGRWRLRVIPNKFPALTPEGDTRREEQGLFRRSDGYGRHEVIIETPLHNQFIPLMDNGHVKDLVRAYRDRYHALRQDPNIKLIIIFKNHGAGAGTSLEHPHSQIVATPVVPPYIRRRYEVATRHFDDTGRCLHHDILQAELKDGSRIVAETAHFVVLHPYASRYPFETWIMPIKHRSSFGNISDDEVVDVACVLKDTLLKLHLSLKDPDYNLIIHTAPVDDEHKSYYLWHIQIIPRITHAAGFELGSGIYINVAIPEETARFMRSARSEQAQGS